MNEFLIHFWLSIKIYYQIQAKMVFFSEAQQINNQPTKYQLFINYAEYNFNGNLCA